MNVAETCNARPDDFSDADWRPLGRLATNVVQALRVGRCGSVVSVAFTSSTSNSEGVRPSNELAGTWSVMELALNRDIASHGFA